MRVVVRLHGLILRDTLLYLRHTLVPMLLLIVPLVPVLAQLNLFFSSTPLQPGQSALVKLKVADPELVRAGVNLDGNSAVRVETPGVHIVSDGEVAWRIRAEQPGDHRLVFRVGSQSVEKSVRVGGRWGAVPGLKTADWFDLLLYPGEEPLDPAAKVRSIEVRYEPLSLEVLGWKVHWIILFFILSVAVSFAFKGVLGVEV
jgi:hypothetical protein